MSTSWAAPDRRPVVAAPPVFSAPPPVSEDPPLPRELLAGVLTALGVLLCGPVVGVVWAALAPRPDLSENGYPRDPETSAFIAGDGVLLVAGVVVGLLTGLVAWRLGRRYGLGVVAGLALGGLAAAYVAKVVGEGPGAVVSESVRELIGRPGAASAEGAGGEAAGDFAFRLRASEVLVGWPVGGLLGFVTASALSRLSVRSRPGGTAENQSSEHPASDQPTREQPTSEPAASEQPSR